MLSKVRKTSLSSMFAAVDQPFSCFSSFSSYFFSSYFFSLFSSQCFADGTCCVFGVCSVISPTALLLLLLVCIAFTCMLIHIVKDFFVGPSLISRQTYNTLLLGMILVCTRESAYRDATEVPLLFGAPRTDPGQFLWLWGTNVLGMVFTSGYCLGLIAWDPTADGRRDCHQQNAVA